MNLYKITTIEGFKIYYLGNSFSEIEKKREGKPKISNIELIQSNIE